MTDPRPAADQGDAVVRGRLVLPDRVVAGRIRIEGGRIASIEPDDDDDAAHAGPYVAPGFIDLHVHGWGGHDAMGGPAELDGMARAMFRHGVTSFLPTAVSAPLDVLRQFAATVRAWMPQAPHDGAAPLGFNLEGPFLSHDRRGAHDAAALLVAANVPTADLEPLLEGLRVITIAPELPGAPALIAHLHERGVRVALGHSGATADEARAGYAAGAMATTHLFNAMGGLDHRRPGLAAAALTDDRVWVELIADGEHVHPSLWQVVVRAKPRDRLVLVSDAIALAGTGDGRGTVGGLEVEVRGGRSTLVDGGALAGSVIALDAAVRNLVRAGIDLPVAVAAASANPAGLLGLDDRGRLAVGLRAHLVELDDDLGVLRVRRDDGWVEGAGARG